MGRSSRTGRRHVKRAVLRVVMLGAVFSSTLHAQEVIGNWQGTMQISPGLRAVLQISKAECNSLSGKLYSLGDDPHPISLTSVTLLNRVLRSPANRPRPHTKGNSAMTARRSMAHSHKATPSRLTSIALLRKRLGRSIQRRTRCILSRSKRASDSRSSSGEARGAP